MMVLTATISIALGVSYLALGAIAAAELISSRRTRGMSQFGLGYLLMASSCGPHHLLHASHVLHGDDVSLPIAGVTLLGLPSGLVFVGLRVEAMFDRRGDRFISGTPNWLLWTPALSLVTFGALLALAADGSDIAADPFSAGRLANLFVAVTYALVGVPLLRTQIRRRSSAGGWSVAGLSLATIFPTCAASHLTYALTTSGDIHVTIIDLWGVPASVYFLWVVRSIYHDAIVDWNARPVTGDRRHAPRQPPWYDQRRRAPTRPG